MGTRLLPTLALAILFTGFGAPVSAQQSPALTPAQADAVRALVRDYILQNPEIVSEAVRLLQEREQAQTLQKQRQAFAALEGDIFHDPSTPILGNPKGDVTIVEFFDYRCGYCKQAAPAIAKLLEEDRNIRLVVKEFPILGPESVVAARAALAAGKQNKYAPFHWALLNAKGQLDEAQVMRIAGQVGLDTKQLRQDMAAPEIEAAIKRSYGLAEALQIRGTPAFIVGEELVPGAVDLPALKALVAKARKS
ncbi:MAG: DsbA family protein [Alphaproteobacteria bacterium]|nr:DsbA family protein [Alphaproteobacteria bacterium]